MKVSKLPLFIPDVNLLSWELNIFTFNVFYWVILYWYYIKTIQDLKTLKVPCKISKTVSFASSIMRNIAVPFSLSSLPVKLICCILVDQH